MIAKLEDQKQLLQAQINSALQCVDDVTAFVEAQEQKYLCVRQERTLLRKVVNHPEKVIEDLE